jgi:hypothetical protein
VRGVVAVANDSAVIVRGTTVMTAEFEPLEANHGLSAARREPRGRAADAAEADDGDVVALHGMHRRRSLYALAP